MSDTEFDDDATVDVDEALLAQIRAEAARRAGGSGGEVSDKGSRDADEVPDSVDEATQDVEPEVLESIRGGDYEEDAPTIDGYGALREIGRGGFSRVYEALEFEFQRWVAIKVINETFESDEEMADFERECRLTGVLSRHPNIVTVFASAFTSEHRPCIVMELFPHGSYLNILQRMGPLSLEELLPLAVRISGALATAHRQGMVHGDVKPQNIFRSEFGDAALGDFGIATLMHQRTGIAKTRLSLYYAAPELIESGVAATSPFADQYSLAATIYTLATGLRPFQTDTGDTTEQLLSRMLREPAPRLGEEFPKSLDEILRQAMTREPQDRHRDVVALAAAIAKVEQELGFKPTEIPTTRDAGRYVGQTPTPDTSRSTTASRSQDSPATPPTRTGDRPPGSTSREQVVGADSRTVVRPMTPAATASPAPEPQQSPEKPRIPLWAKIGSAAAAVLAAVAIYLLVANGGGSPPEAPVDVTLQEGDGRLVVSWEEPDDGGSAITGYRVELDLGGTRQDQGEAPPGDRSWEFTGLVNGETYEVRVAALNEVGASDFAQESGVPQAEPDPPGDLVVQGRDGRLVVSWEEPDDGGSAITGYRVELDLGGTRQDQGEAPPGDRSWEFTGLVNGETYEVRVAALNEVGASDFAQESGVPQAEPDPPGDLVVQGRDGRLVVSWEEPDDGGSAITGYRVELDLGGTRQDQGEAPPGDRSWEFTGLVNGETYEARVAALNEVGASDFAQKSGVPGPGVGPPGAPVDVVVQGRDGRLVVSWEEPDDGGSAITGYLVELDLGGTRQDQGEAPPGDRSWEFTGLVNGETYEVSVAAMNEVDTGDYARQIGIPRAEPGLPGDVTLQEGDGRLLVSWEEPDDGGSAITGYFVELYLSGTLLQGLWVPPNSRSEEFTGLVNGETYEVRVAAANEVDIGDFTSAAGVPLADLVGLAFTSNYEGQDAIYYADFRRSGDALELMEWKRVTDSDREEGSPSVSPDGSWIAFNRRTAKGGHWQIFVRNIDSGVERQLICQSDNGWSPTWSPDGRSIAFARGSGGNDIWTINVETGEAKSLKDIFDRDDAYPSWSSDGDTIAFARRNYDPRRSRAYNSRSSREIRILTGVSDTATGIGVALLTKGYTEGDYTSPDWSPDGYRIAYSISLTDSEYRHIDVMDRDGNKLQQLTREHHDDDPSWSPDGQWVAFARGEGGSRDLYVVSTAGGEPVPLLVHGVFDYGAPNWSPNRDVRVDPTFDCG